jgi:arylsulfatase A-like enzyme
MPPNILMIVVDCLRADFVYEEGLAEIPTLKKLLGEGAHFRNVISVMGLTPPVFAGLLTGEFPARHGVWTLSRQKLNPDLPTLPALLKGHGYQTHAEFTGPLRRYLGFDGDFDDYACRPRTETIHSEWGERFLRDRLRACRAPWFLMLHVWSLHEPRIVLPECRMDRFGRTEYGRALSSIDRWLARLLPALPEDTVVIVTGDHGELISYGPWDRRYKRARRWAFLRLRKLGLTWQHPVKFMRRAFEGHDGAGFPEEILRIPLLLWKPGLVPVSSSDIQVRQIDIMPTVLDLVGLKAPQGMTGHSLLPLARGADEPHRDAFFGDAGAPHMIKKSRIAGIRVDNRYKYMYSPFRRGFTPELFDLMADPEEQRNIAKEHPEICADLRGRIEALGRSTLPEHKLDEESRKQLSRHLKSLGYMD